MRRVSRLTIAVALPLVALTTAARAQLAGIPVYFNVEGGTGVGVAANLGFPDNNAGGGTAYGVAGSLSGGAITLTGMVGAWKGTGFGSAQASYGGDVAMRLFGGGLLPVAVGVQAGYGAVKNPITSTTVSTIPIGIGVALNPPLFPLKPWIAPRIEIQHVPPVAGGGAVNATAFRVSAGVNFNLLLGLGVHAGVDWGKVPSKLDPATPSTLIWGVGAHFNFHVPMM